MEAWTGQLYSEAKAFHSLRLNPFTVHPPALLLYSPKVSPLLLLLFHPPCFNPSSLPFYRLVTHNSHEICMTHPVILLWMDDGAAVLMT